MRLSRNRTILITGTTRGLGAHLANGYTEDGCTVIGLNRPGHDFSQGQTIHLPEHDALILNAGIGEMSLIAIQPVSAAEKIARVNYIGPFNALQSSLRTIKRPGGRIIAIGTIAVPGAFKGEAAYGSSKAALHELVRIASREFGPYGITVNCVAPCLLDGGLARGVPEKIKLQLRANQAIPRPATFQDVKNACDLLLSEKADFITGQIIYLGGPW